MGTLVARVPADWLRRLDAISPNRNEAARIVLELGIEAAALTEPRKSA
jgi:hypothetical protein